MSLKNSSMNLLRDLDEMTEIRYEHIFIFFLEFNKTCLKEIFHSKYILFPFLK